MNDTVIIALISFAGTLFGTLAGIITSSKLVNYRIEQLEDRVNKHNNLIERTYNLERERDLIKQEIKVANHRIDDLEHKSEAS